VQAIDTCVTLDQEQLREVTMNDLDLMRELLAALIDDTSQQIELLQAAVQEHDSGRCMRLAHYSKGACANVGAASAAALLKRIEVGAAAREFPECGEALASLAVEVTRLREEARILTG
jgi:HPt (histidine-containing phosphotransfer) domain-containing protein